MELNNELKAWIRMWDNSLEYYMEEKSVPTDRKEREAYYREARAFLSDRLTDMWMMARKYSASSGTSNVIRA